MFEIFSDGTKGYLGECSVRGSLVRQPSAP
jgi:hypothetical protein